MKDKHVLITGHTGFKGAWLTAMLEREGARVSGVALNPRSGGIFDRAGIGNLLANDIRLDIRDPQALDEAFQKVSPDLVIHLAAQPLVLQSYDDPRESYETNVMGTFNVLQAAEIPSVSGVLVITSDKVYQQQPGARKPFVENDALGAGDPYSTSKAMADLLTQSWISNHTHRKVAIARAGNVIGGGDVAPNRLIPDLVRSFALGEKAHVRNPGAVRPWQHVLDCLNGYLVLAQAISTNAVVSTTFNFGPDSSIPMPVRNVAELASRTWGEAASWEPIDLPQPHEAEFLTLDSSKAKSELGWSEKLTSVEAVNWTVEWEARVFKGENPMVVTLEQLERFRSL